MEPTITKQDIRKVSKADLQLWLSANKHPKFRAKQIDEWLWQKGKRSFDEMTNLSKDLRQSLNENFVINGLTVDEFQISTDGTIKLRLKLHDGLLIEGVLIPADDRFTACVSSQVGCSLTCKFCATGQMKRMRNLEVAEIFDQVVILNEICNEYYGSNLTNVVYMGMGEPLLNYKNVLESINRLTSEEGLHMGARRITVSTAGIAKMIVKLADDNGRINLALSLHAANDAKRDKIMPINEQNNLDILKDALRYYADASGRLLYFEYIIFNNFNDKEEDALELVEFCRGLPCKVNIIEYNPVSGTGMGRAQYDKVLAFQQIVADNGIKITLRRSRGKDIDAACGQLANKKATA